MRIIILYARRLPFGFVFLDSGFLENTDLENVDHRPQTSKTQTLKMSVVVYLLIEKLRPFILDGKKKI